MKHRPIILAWLFAFIFVVGLATTASAATLSLVPSKDPVARGEIFYLDIVIDDPTGVAGCTFTLTFPDDRLIAPDPEAEGEVPEITSTFFQNFSGTRMHRENISTEEIHFSGANINSSTGGAPWTVPDMILFTIPFTVLPDPGMVGQTITFTLKQTELLNADAGWGDGTNAEPAPVLVGAVDNTHADWDDLAKAFPVLLGDQTNPFTTVTLVTSAIVDCTDTDQDDLCDSVETNTGTYVDPLNTGTDPNNDDSDGDGLNDGDEVNTHLTNPLNSDSDGDGMPDGWEVANAYDPNDDSEPLAQLVSTDPEAPRAGPGTTFSMDAYYTTSDDNQNLSGLELRIHYDSSKLTWDSFSEVLTGWTVQDTQAQDDTADYDGDTSTDKYLTVGWSAADWPGAALPLKLFTVNFTVDAGLQDGDTSVINFSEVSTDANYVFYSAPVVVDVRNLALGDVNGDEVVNSGDAILVLRYSVGLTSLTDEQCHGGNVTSKPDDHDINSGDAIKILRYSVGLIPSLD